MFELFFPVKFVQDVMLAKMNENITENVSYGEFLRWIGLWFIMATTYADWQHDFWSSKPPNLFGGVSV